MRERTRDNCFRGKRAGVVYDVWRSGALDVGWLVVITTWGDCCCNCWGCSSSSQLQHVCYNVIGQSQVDPEQTIMSCNNVHSSSAQTSHHPPCLTITSTAQFSLRTTQILSTALRTTDHPVVGTHPGQIRGIPSVENTKWGDSTLR